MNAKTPDQTPNPDETPTTGTPAPDGSAAADAPTVPVAPATAHGTAADGTPMPDATAAPHPAAAEATPPAKPRRTRALLIGGGIAAAVLLAGGGVAVGAAIGDEFGDDDRPAVDGPRHGDRDGEHGPRGDHGPRDDDRDDRPANAGGPVTGIGTASVDELLDIAEAARGAADGEVTSIDAKRDGTWEVQLTTAAGDESDVRVDDDLDATVAATERADEGDTGPALTLDEETIRALVEAALAEADGRITDLDVDADDVNPYDASVLTDDNRSIDISFDASFAVVGTDLDD